MSYNTSIIAQSVSEYFHERIKQYSLPETIEIEDGVVNEQKDINGSIQSDKIYISGNLGTTRPKSL